MPESQAHKSKKHRVASQLRDEDYQVEVEHCIEGFRLDVFATKQGKEICVEVGQTTEDKVEWAIEEFDEFRHVGYERDGEVVKKVIGRRNKGIVVNLSDDGEAMLEDLRDTFEIKPSKRKVVEKALKEYHDKRIQKVNNE